MRAGERTIRQARRPMAPARTALPALAVLMALVLAVALAACGAKLAAGFDEAAVKQAARTAVQRLNAGQYDQITNEMVRADLRQALSPAVLANGAAQVLSGAGAFSSFSNEVVAGTRDQKTGEDFAVAVMVAKYANKSVTYTLSFDRNMNLVGFFLK